jgi:cardiolipin synthase
MNSTAKIAPAPLDWSKGNRFTLLENGEQYFPAVFEAIAAAQREVFVETFILFDDEVGRTLHAVLIDVAKRGVSVHLTVDGYGSPDLSDAFIAALTRAGVHLHVFDPRPRLLGMRTNIFRRMHRKIVTVDGEVAFVGGINFGADQLIASGKMAKQDYAVRIDGPLAKDIHAFATQQVAAFDGKRSWWTLRFNSRRADTKNQGKAIFVFRDNDKHRDDIERHYRSAIRTAKRDILIACAYFFPGYRLLRQLRHAARRGIDVKVILQGAPDMPKARAWATLLYPSLLQAGVKLYEYCERPLHAKVAAVDDEWVTIGSSNLDPLSLALNLEANVVIRDSDFNRTLRSSLMPLLEKQCKQIDAAAFPRHGMWRMFSNFATYHCTRHFPRWAGWLPAHLPKLHSVEPRQLPFIETLPHSLGASGDRCQN